MTAFPNLGRVLIQKYYAEEKLYFALAHSDEEPGKHRIYYTQINDEGLEKLQEEWQHFDIETEVIDFCYGANTGFLYVLRKGQHLERFQINKDARNQDQPLFKTIEGDYEITQITLLHEDLVMVLALKTPEVLVLDINSLTIKLNKIDHAVFDMKVVDDYIIAKQKDVKTNPLCLLACVKGSL